MTKKRTPTLMFELNSSYSNVQKTKTKTASRSCFWLPKIHILDETIEERCARAVSRKTPNYVILEIKWKSITSTLVLLHWSLTLECSSGLVGLYNVTSNCIRSIYNCEVYLGEAIHHFPQFIVREIVQSRSFTPFLPWKKPQLIKVFNNLMNVSKNIHENKSKLF